MVVEKKYINLVWDTNTPDYLYVAGHIGFEEGIKEIQKNDADIALWGTRWNCVSHYKKAIITKSNQKYARYVPDSTGVFSMNFFPKNRAGKGCFKVTEFVVDRWYMPLQIG